MRSDHPGLSLARPLLGWFSQKSTPNLTPDISVLFHPLTSPFLLLGYKFSLFCVVLKVEPTLSPLLQSPIGSHTHHRVLPLLYGNARGCIDIKGCGNISSLTPTCISNPDQKVLYWFLKALAQKWHTSHTHRSLDTAKYTVLFNFKGVEKHGAGVHGYSKSSKCICYKVFI